MIAMSKAKFLHSGTEVITNDRRIGIVEQFQSEQRIIIRYHNRVWPFPEWDVKSRRQLTIVDPVYDAAPF